MIIIIHCNYYSAFEVDGSEDIFFKLLVLLWSDETEFMELEYILYRNFSRHIYFTLIILLFDQKLSIKLHLLCDFNI